MLAVIQAGGKQYCVAPGSKLIIDRMNAEVGAKLSFPDLLGNGSVTAEVIDHLSGPKVVTRKFRNKTRYHRLKGHRQPLTVLAFSGQESVETKKTAERKKTAPVEEAVATVGGEA